MANFLSAGIIAAIHPRYYLNRNSMLCIAIRYNYISVVKYIIKHGADVNVPEMTKLPSHDFRMSPLMLAAKFDRCEIAELLINNGADVNYQIQYWGVTALHIAVKTGNLSIVTFLLSRGANVNIKNFDGYTPLHKAIIYQCNVDIIKKLLEYGADICLMDNEEGTECEGLTPFDIAVNSHDYKTITLLVSHIVRIEHAKHTSIKSAGFIHNKELINKYKMLQRIYCSCQSDILKLEQLQVNIRYNMLDAFSQNNFEVVTKCVHKTEITSFHDNLEIYRMMYKDFIDACIVRSKLLKQMSIMMNDIFTQKDDKCSTSWIDLPREIQSKVFAYLSNDELKIASKTKLL